MISSKPVDPQAFEKTARMTQQPAEWDRLQRRLAELEEANARLQQALQEEKDDQVRLTSMVSRAQAEHEAELAARRQVERELQEKRENYQSIFESTNDGMVICTLEGEIVEANLAFCAMHGYTREELLGKSLFEVSGPQVAPKVRDYFSAIRRGEHYSAQAPVRHRNGTLFNVDAHGSRLMYRGQPHALGVIHDISDRVQAFALLEQRVEEKTHELATLLEVSHNMASTLELKPLLSLILEQMKTVVPYTGAAIYTAEEEGLRVIHYSGPGEADFILHQTFGLDRMPPHRNVVTTKEPVLIMDLRGDDPLGKGMFSNWDEALNTSFQYIRSWMGIPMIIQDRVIGMFGIGYAEPGFYTDRHVRLALAFASHAAVALENARLYQRTQRTAALEERQRLARELHDSVSQALYGIQLGAQTARGLVQHPPEGGTLGDALNEPLDYVVQLAEAGLAEMRALIFELRPESLQTEGLVAGLAKQAASVRARHGLQVETEWCDEPEAPLEVKEALYRIAQESLHNIVKHARATQVHLRLVCAADRMALHIQDNGRGFDPAGSFPGHLGLRSMRERVERLGGTFEVESEPGQGTRIHVEIPV